jgi:3-phosphoshikimate 1-carboxyvinyltransferase
MSGSPRADPYPVESVAGPVEATVTVPGSKSLTNRALVCAALAEGESRLTGALVADDTEAMRIGLELLGARIAPGASPTDLDVVGLGGVPTVGAVDVDARQSGTTARFLAPVLALGRGPYRLDGDLPLRRRSMAPVIELLREAGIEVDEDGEPGHLPIVIRGWRQWASELSVDASVSSQFVSGLLMAAPYFSAGLDLSLTGPVVSRPYLDMTVEVMKAFGGVVEPLGDRAFRVESSAYRGRTFAIEPDASSASYLLAAAALVGGQVVVEGLGRSSLQGDAAFAGVLEQMGAMVRQTDDSTTVSSDGRLRGVDVDLVDMPDMAQTVAAVAVFADGPTRVRGVGIIRDHETDRIASVVAELTRAGIDARETDDGFVIEPGQPRPAVIQTYRDHRMAMSFALLGLKAPGIEIADPACVGKTFPGYWDRLDQLRTGAPTSGD